MTRSSRFARASLVAGVGSTLLTLSALAQFQLPRQERLIREGNLIPPASQPTTQPGLAQSFLDSQLQLDLTNRQERERVDPLATHLDFQWGGWIDYYFFYFQDGFQRQRLFQQPGMSLWARIRVDDTQELYARMRLQYNYFNPGDQLPGEDQQDFGVWLDRLWWDVDVLRALKITTLKDPIQFGFRVGRQDVRFGTGYALDLPMDAVTINLTLWDLKVTGLIGQSIYNYPNIDPSPSVADHMSRNFYGAQLTYTGMEKLGLGRHEPFFYFVINDDHTPENPVDRLQNYSYDTQYFGWGSRGQIIENLNYWAEIVYETGRSYGNGMFTSRDPVVALGWDFGLEYLFPGPMAKRLAFEYMFGSGDGNRILNATGSLGGNRHNTVDNAFVAFGFRDTGLALSPANTNLNIFKFGGSLRPFEKTRYFRDLEVGTNWFIFQKNQAGGAISDPTADQFEGFVGWEMDYFINWRLMSDLAWTIRYGIFFPGDAYSDQAARNFLMTGFTWSF